MNEFFKRHWFGWLLSVLTAVSAMLGYDLYTAFRSQIEVRAATNQVNDSVLDFVLYQQIANNNLIDTLIVLVVGILVFMFLTPTFVDIFRTLKSHQSGE